MNYYIADGTNQRGPYSEQELMGVGLRPDMLVWREGMSQWMPAAQVPELQTLLGTAPTPTTPPPTAPPTPGPVSPNYFTPPQAAPYATVPPMGDISGKKIAAGICGILFGTFGVHKFILGLTSGAVTMLVISLVCLALTPFTCGVSFVAVPVMHIIGIIEGIIYLCKSDADFYQVYMVQKQQWF